MACEIHRLLRKRRMNFRNGLRRHPGNPRRSSNQKESRAIWAGEALLIYIPVLERSLRLSQKTSAGFTTWKLLQNKRATFKHRKRKRVGWLSLKRLPLRRNPLPHRKI